MLVMELLTAMLLILVMVLVMFVMLLNRHEHQRTRTTGILLPCTITMYDVCTLSTIYGATLHKEQGVEEKEVKCQTCTERWCFFFFGGGREAAVKNLKRK